jgi:hypothetical protein
VFPLSVSPLYVPPENTGIAAADAISRTIILFIAYPWKHHGPILLPGFLVATDESAKGEVV